MKKLFIALIGAAALVGCAVEAQVPGVSVGVGIPLACDAYVGEVGYYNDGCGYWTGSAWDVDFYSRGHAGYGHGHWHSRDTRHGGHRENKR